MQRSSLPSGDFPVPGTFMERSCCFYRQGNWGLAHPYGKWWWEWHKTPGLWGHTDQCYPIHQLLSPQVLAVNMRLLWMFLFLGCLFNKRHVSSSYSLGEPPHPSWKLCPRKFPKRQTDISPCSRRIRITRSASVSESFWRHCTLS